MSDYVTLTIDGARIRAPRETWVLDAALDYGICIPHLCHVEGLSPLGACRLCLVEVVSNGDSAITTSCTLDVKEGLVILAHTEQIRRIRKNLAEMLVAEAPNSRAIQDIGSDHRRLVSHVGWLSGDVCRSLAYLHSRQCAAGSLGPRASARSARGSSVIAHPSAVSLTPLRSSRVLDSLRRTTPASANRKLQ